MPEMNENGLYECEQCGNEVPELHDADSYGYLCEHCYDELIDGAIREDY